MEHDPVLHHVFGSWGFQWCSLYLCTFSKNSLNTHLVRFFHYMTWPKKPTSQGLDVIWWVAFHVSLDRLRYFVLRIIQSNGLEIFCWLLVRYTKHCRVIGRNNIHKDQTITNGISFRNVRVINLEWFQINSWNRKAWEPRCHGAEFCKRKYRGGWPCWLDEIRMFVVIEQSVVSL